MERYQRLNPALMAWTLRHEMDPSASRREPFMVCTRNCFKTAFFFLISSFLLGGSALVQAEDTVTALKQGQVFADMKALEAFLAHDGGSVSGTTTGELAGIGEVQAISIRHTEPLMSLQIALLTHDTNGSLRVIAQTLAVASGYIEAATRIERGSLFIDLDAIKGAWGRLSVQAASRWEASPYWYQAPPRE